MIQVLALLNAMRLSSLNRTLSEGKMTYPYAGVTQSSYGKENPFEKTSNFLGKKCIHIAILNMFNIRSKIKHINSYILASNLEPVQILHSG